MNSWIDTALWGVLPYVAFTLLIGGLIWRYKTDQYGWTSRSSGLHEKAILRLASPLFHFGILMVGAGHIVGLAVPAPWTEAVGVSEHLYHLAATGGGAVGAIMTVVGLLGLIYRRLVTKTVRLATSRNDLVMYVFLCLPIALGTYATVHHQIFGWAEGGYNYRETISVWFRSIFSLQPNIAVMSEVPTDFKLHIIAGLVLFALWPFTRLVHVLSAPIAYPTRPYVVYRSRQAATGTARPHRGWDPVQRTSAPVHTDAAHGA